MNSKKEILSSAQTLSDSTIIIFDVLLDQTAKSTEKLTINVFLTLFCMAKACKNERQR
jgi:hypothetical protein